MVKLKGSEEGDIEAGVIGSVVKGMRYTKKGVLRFTPRPSETDSQTRGEGRIGVRMEPATKAIINVYELVQKTKAGGRAEKKSGRSQPAVASTAKAGSGQKSAPVSKSRRSIVPGFEQYMVRPDGSLELDAEQKRKTTDKEYTRLNNEHRVKLAEIISKQRSEEEAKTVAAIKTAQESRTAFKSDSPKNILVRRMKELKIPLTTEAKIDNDIRYSGRPLTDEGIAEINRAFDAAIAEGRMSEVPPPFIALTTRTNSPMNTTTVYIKNDLSFRRRKMTHTKVKRPMHANKRKMPLVKGSKKRVVMKKKGGRR